MIPTIPSESVGFSEYPCEPAYDRDCARFCQGKFRGRALKWRIFRGWGVRKGEKKRGHLQPPRNRKSRALAPVNRVRRCAGEIGDRLALTRVPAAHTVGMGQTRTDEAVAQIQPGWEVNRCGPRRPMCLNHPAPARTRA